MNAQRKAPKKRLTPPSELEATEALFNERDDGSISQRAYTAAMRFHWLLLALPLACGPLRDPFATLPAGACTQDADCVIAACPNACNQGRPFCTYPAVHARADVVKACPCVDKPTAPECAAPAVDACGPQPGCAGPFDVDQLRARCAAGTCEARFTDGGVPGP
jgi:hypothetical protein